MNLLLLKTPLPMLLSLLLLLATTHCFSAFGQQVPQPPPEITEMARAFRTRTLELTKQYEKTIKLLPQQYQRDIKVLHDRYRQKGDLDGVLATSREIKRFQKALSAERDPFELTPEMPPSAVVAKPPELRQLQEQYVKHFKDAADNRLHEIRDLVGRYLGRLQTIQVDLTRSGRIDEAVFVKQQSERLKKGLKSGNLISVTEQMAYEMTKRPTGETRPADSNAGGGNGPVFGNIPNWSKWRFIDSANFARERTQYDHPDLPEELTVVFSEKTGRGRFYGRCRVGSKQIDVGLARWFGKALIWEVADRDALTTTFVLTSKEISAGEEHGPAVQLALLANGVPLRAINVNLYESETTLRLVKDPRSNRCALMWPRGGVTETFALPADSKISVLLGITVRNPGEMCDTVLLIQ